MELIELNKKDKQILHPQETNRLNFKHCNYGNKQDEEVCHGLMQNAPVKQTSR